MAFDEVAPFANHLMVRRSGKAVPRVCARGSQEEIGRAKTAFAMRDSVPVAKDSDLNSCKEKVLGNEKEGYLDTIMQHWIKKIRIGVFAVWEANCCLLSFSWRKFLPKDLVERLLGENIFSPRRKNHPRNEKLQNFSPVKEW